MYRPLPTSQQHPYSIDYEAQDSTRPATPPRTIKGHLLSATRWRGTKQKMLWIAALCSIGYVVHTINSNQQDQHRWHPHLNHHDGDGDIPSISDDLNFYEDVFPPPSSTSSSQNDTSSELPIDSKSYISPRRSIPPSHPNPWIDSKVSIKKGGGGAFEWLNSKRFGSTAEGWNGKGMKDPPIVGEGPGERAIPQSRYLLKAFEFASKVKTTSLDSAKLLSKGGKDGGEGGGGGFVGLNGEVERDMGSGSGWDEATGRPLMVDRKRLNSKSGHKSPSLPKGYRVSELGSGKMKEKILNRVQADKVIDREREGAGRGKNDEERRVEEEERRDWVKRAFLHAWEGYKKHAWGHDELAPVSNLFSNNYNGWGATLVDNLDTLLIMNLSHEYNLARQHVKSIDFTYLVPSSPRFFSSKLPSLHSLDITPNPSIDYTEYDKEGGGRTHNKWIDARLQSTSSPYSPTTIPLFETTIRYLGGLLSAYDLSGGDPLMLSRAKELGDWLLPSLNTDWGLAVPRYRIGSNPDGGAIGRAVLAEVGSLELELTKLSLITGDETYYQAAQRTMDTLETRFAPSSPSGPDVSNTGKIRGRLGTLLPSHIDPARPQMVQGEYTFGGLADSYYEYLIKQAQLMSLSLDQYPRMYKLAIESAYQYLMKPIETVPGREEGMLNIGTVNWGAYRHELQHLTCFAGGMLGLGAKLLDRPKDLEAAVNFTEACAWVYESSATGIGGESTTFYKNDDPSRFVVGKNSDGESVRQPRGNPAGVRTANRKQIGRPETIESVFYMWRLTGDRYWQDQGWKMFTSWVEHSITESGFATVSDVNSIPVRKDDSMESFVTAETLKYYYLLFSPRDFISLDDYVFNTEAHPFWIPKPPSSPSVSSKLPPKALWTGPEREVEEGFVDQVGEGTWVQKWARIQQASRLAGRLRELYGSASSKEKKVEYDDWDEEEEGGGGEDFSKEKVPKPIAVRPPIRPSEEELAKARAKDLKEEGKGGEWVPPPPDVRGGGGRGMGGGAPPPG